jgi:uncharacterized RDD family membrane protein YckC
MENEILDNHIISSPIKYASFGDRFIATIIDYLIGMLIGLVIQGIGLNQMLIGLLWGWLYSALMESSSNKGTLGKMALGIIVTDDNGKRINFGKATARHFARVLSGLILFIGFFMMLGNERKKCLHDQIVGTVVLKK